MYKKVQIRLTILYSIFFLVFIWLSSAGLLFWEMHTFEENYAHELKERSQKEFSTSTPDFGEEGITKIAGSIALGHLELLIGVINFIILLFVPIFIWIITGRSLQPMEDALLHERQFISNIAHDLRTPLTALGTEMDVTLKKDRSVNEYKKMIKSNRQEIFKLNSLFDDLLFLARHDAHSLAQKLTPIDLVDTVSSVIARLIPLAEKKNLKIKFNLPTEEVIVYGNASLISQLITNLIDNAIKYTDKGKITVSISKSLSFAQLEIVDTGSGIPYSEHQRIFDRFYRIDLSRSLTAGYGLGLAIAKTIVELHKGRIVLDSQPQRGSHFKVELPLFKQNLENNLS